MIEKQVVRANRRTRLTLSPRGRRGVRNCAACSASWPRSRSSNLARWGFFAFPIGMPPDGGSAPLFSQMGLAGVLETFGGALLLLGLFTRPVAFVLSGEMAVAYFLVSAPLGFWTIINGGVSTVLYCFLWLYFSSAGAGPWSLDALRGAEPNTGLPRGARALVRRVGAG